MAFSNDLLEQAKFLVHLDPNKPKQANLRRAVSTAYYAAFHLLAAAAADQATSAKPTALSVKVRRALDHGEMKVAAQSFSAPTPPKNIAPLLQGQVSRELVSVANAFIRLQEDRHKADYDLSSRLDRADAEGAVLRATRLFQDWSTVRGNDEARVFLAALMFNKKWNR